MVCSPKSFAATFAVVINLQTMLVPIYRNELLSFVIVLMLFYFVAKMFYSFMSHYNLAALNLMSYIVILILFP